MLHHEGDLVRMGFGRRSDDVAQDGTDVGADVGVVIERQDDELPWVHAGRTVVRWDFGAWVDVGSKTGHGVAPRGRKSGRRRHGVEKPIRPLKTVAKFARILVGDALSASNRRVLRRDGLLKLLVAVERLAKLVRQPNGRGDELVKHHGRRVRLHCGGRREREAAMARTGTQDAVRSRLLSPGHRNTARAIFGQELRVLMHRDVHIQSTPRMIGQKSTHSKIARIRL